MPDSNDALDPAFVEAQRRRLEAMRAESAGGERQTIAEEQAFAADHGEEAREAEEEGQRMARIEIEQDLNAARDRRLAAIDRALRKIEDGSYGLSDESGDPIPKARLEAIPEVRLTVEEEERRERERRL